MQRKYKYLIFILSLTTIISCSLRQDFSDTPEITYMGMSKNNMNQDEAFTDSLYIYFDFKDGDGDLGFSQSSQDFDIILTDSRTGNERFFRLPQIPEQGTNNGIEGSVELKLYTECCIVEGGLNCCFQPICDDTNEYNYTIKIKDRAGMRAMWLQQTRSPCFASN